MSEDNSKIVDPITNAARPGTLAALSLTVLKFSSNESTALHFLLAAGAILFLLSSFFIFFYTIYNTRRILWICTALTFLFGLLFLVSSSIFIILSF